MDFSYLDSIPEDEAGAAEDKMIGGAGNIWVLGEVKDGSLRPDVLPLVCKARDMADTLSVAVFGVLIGSGMRKAAGELFHYGADRVLLADDPALAEYQPETYIRVLADLISAEQPAIVLALASELGSELVPRLAQTLDTGVVPYCTDLSMDSINHQLVGTYPVGDAGDILYAAVCAARPQLVTVRPQSLSQGFPSPREEVIEEVAVNLDGAQGRMKWLGQTAVELPKAWLTEAAVVVAGGRGMEDAEGFALVRQLADLLGGEVAGTRAALEAGWITEDRLIGVAGVTVRPYLYIACGISGADHHLYGIQDARFIVAINSNPDAPLMKHAHIAVVGDARAVVSALIQELS